MKEAIYLPFGDLERFQRHARFVREAGFCAVGVDLWGMPTDADAVEAVKPYRAILDACGLTCTQTHLPVYDPLVCSTVVDPARENIIRASVSASSVLGAPVCVYHPRTAITKGYDEGIAYEHNREALKPILDVAAKENILVAVENIPVFPDCPQHRFYSSDPEDLAFLVDSFGFAPIGICWDTGHANLMSFNQPKVIKQLGSRILCTHISSNFKEQDWHLLPLYGYLDWKKVMAAFREIGYDRDLTLELRAVDERAAQNFYRLAYDAVSILKTEYSKE